MFSNDPQKTALAGLLRAATRETAPETLAAIRALLHSHDAAVLAGHVMLDLLEENGYGPLDIDAIGATPPTSHSPSPSNTLPPHVACNTTPSPSPAPA